MAPRRRYAVTDDGGTNYRTAQSGDVILDGDGDVVPSVTTQSSAPTVSNDEDDSAGIGKSFFVGALWLDTTTNKLYLCADATAGAAVWNEQVNADYYPATAEPIPIIAEFEAGSFGASGGASQEDVNGINLLAGQVQASVVIETADGGVMTIKAIQPGTLYNAASVEIEAPSGSLEIAYVDDTGTPIVNQGAAGKLIISPAAGGSTIADIVAAIDPRVSWQWNLLATEDAAGTVAAAQAEQSLSGGEGEGISVRIANEPCLIERWTNTYMMINCAPTSANGHIVNLSLQSNKYVATLSIPVTA
jgi:hypothetical protein